MNDFPPFMKNKQNVVNPGDELHIPAGAEQWGEAKAGTRSIHVFGGPRVKAR